MPYKILKDDVESDLKKLGYKNIDIPAGADISDLQNQNVDPNATAQVQVDQNQPSKIPDDNSFKDTTVSLNTDTAVKPAVVNQDVVTPVDTQSQNVQDQQVDPNATVDDQVQPSEQQRRTWQGEADKAKQETEEANRKNEYLMQMFANIAGSGNNQNVATNPVVKVEELKEPQLSDFVSGDDYDPADVLDLRTKTGAAYQKYNSAVRKYDRQTIRKDILSETQQQSQQSVAVRQANVLAEKYPEFRNPFTNEPDMNKIINFIQNVSNSQEDDLYADLYSLKKNRKNTVTNNTPDPNVTIDKVGQRANNVGAVTTKTPASNVVKETPDAVKSAVGIFGDVELPNDATF